jgi:hypothetical protein
VPPLPPAAVASSREHPVVSLSSGSHDFIHINSSGHIFDIDGTDPIVTARTPGMSTPSALT